MAKAVFFIRPADVVAGESRKVWSIRIICQGTNDDKVQFGTRATRMTTVTGQPLKNLLPEASVHFST